MSEEKDMRNACYKCKHRGTILGNCHTMCKHPTFSKAQESPMAQMGALFGVNIVAKSEECVVTSDPHGARWFSHPMNFDPVWLLSCTGFEEAQS